MSRFSSKIKKISILVMVFLLLINFLSISTNASKDIPDLEIDVNLPLPELIEGKESEFIIEITNDGITNVIEGEEISVKLRIDLDYVVSTNSSFNGIPAGSSAFINLSWTPIFDDVGIHLLSFELYYEDILIDPPVDIPNVEIFERDSELEIISFGVSGTLAVNKTSQIQASIINNGKNTTKSFYAKLNSSEDGEVETVVKTGTLPRGETCDFSFNWTPSRFGSQKISVDIVYNGKTHDYEEKTVIVEIEELHWWDENWHYRYFLSVNGSGNVSEFFNFTEFLNDLGATGEFENNTIRIIEYNQSGGVINIVDEYEFKESEGFNPASNAIGTLTWNAVGAPYEKFYCIYFDVNLNQGDRDELIETPGMSGSGNATIGYFGFVDGWWIDSLQPTNGSYCLIEESVDIVVITIAKVENVSAYIFFNEDESHNFTIYLINTQDYTLWSYDGFSFDKEGNWTIQITARDWAGYLSEILEHSFFVGKPDIAAINLTFSTNWPPTSPKIYRNDTVNITALVVSYDANIDSVNVSLEIIPSGLGLIYTDTISVDLIKGKKKYVTFNWKADNSGEFTVIVTVDPENEIDEVNESNNEIIEKIVVHEWPDLAVVDIILPAVEKTEFERVQIDVVIRNEGLANATNYEVKLFIEKDIMTYSDEVDSKLVSINMNKSKTVSLFWDSAKPGQWLVGARVIYNDTKRDTNVLNNRLLSKKILTIRGIERNAPIIIIGDISKYHEQGETVTITAQITDDSGIESVTIKFFNPINTSYSNTMVRTTGDMFKYDFKNTLKEGEYTFEITATDLTIHRNIAKAVGGFVIYEDTSPPVVTYYDAEPYVQLKGEEIIFSCVASDNIGIQTVELIVDPPVFPPSPEQHNMEITLEGKYEFTNTYDTSGKYTYYVRVYDLAGSKTITTPKTFWITSDLDDTDDDGMPDWWEEKYGLNPEEPNDADLDFDGDGYSNLKEYKIGTNPSKDIFIENVAYRIRDNILYLVGSIILFLVILILPYIIKRRKSK